MIRERHRTKIIWSLENSTLNEETAKDLAKNSNIGAVRIIYDPSYVNDILEFIPLFNSYRSPEFGSIPIMIDVGALPRGTVYRCQTLKLEYAQEITLSAPDKGGDLEILSDEWTDLFRVNESLYLGYGSLELEIIESSNAELVRAKVLKGGEVVPGQVLHVPATKKVPSIFDLSFIDIKPFQDIGIDYVILPGFTSARELALVRKKLGSAVNGSPWILVRMDNRDSCQHVEELCKEADGVYISRRELALTIDAATVPMVCKEMIRTCNENAKLVIIGSEILASMQHAPTPTRAEVSDIANAVIDGTDAIVLSEDIIQGKFFKRALAVCESVIEDVEENTGLHETWEREALSINDEFDAVSFHAFKTAERIKAKAIVCITKFGNTALSLASFRSELPIIAVTFSKEVKRRLSLVRNVYSMLLDIDPNLDEVLPAVSDLLKNESWLSSGDRIVFVTVTISPMAKEASNLFTIQRLE